jgi:3-oxoadipate enol-lactonase
MSAFAEVNATRLYYEKAGSGPPVVLLHEAVTDSRMWDDQLGLLSARHLVVRYDMRGYGRSLLPGGPYSHVDDLRALFDAIEIGRATLVGASLGGRVALEFALTDPERVRSLMLAPAALGGHEWSEEVKESWRAEDAALEAGDLDAAVEINLRQWVDGPRRAPDAVSTSVRERVGVMQRRALETFLHASAQAPQPGPEQWPEPPAQTRLGEIDVPTLLLVGDEDVPDMHEIADRLAETMPRARKRLIRGAGHVINLERPDEFEACLLDFLAKTTGEG